MACASFERAYQFNCPSTFFAEMASPDSGSQSVPIARKKPLSQSKSLSAFTNNNGGSKKTESSFELRAPGVQLTVQEEDGLRRRSHSAPMTLEATVVAKELTKLSDSLQSRYERSPKVSIPKRRATTGGSVSNKRRSWPLWTTIHRGISEDSEGEAKDILSTSCPSGTSV